MSAGHAHIASIRVLHHGEHDRVLRIELITGTHVDFIVPLGVLRTLVCPLHENFDPREDAKDAKGEKEP